MDPDDLGARKKTGSSSSSGFSGKPHEMEKLAAAIEKLEENDLLPIVKIILDNQTQDMYVKTDVEGFLPKHPTLDWSQLVRGRVSVRLVHAGEQHSESIVGLYKKEGGSMMVSCIRDVGDLPFVPFDPSSWMANSRDRDVLMNITCCTLCGLRVDDTDMLLT